MKKYMTTTVISLGVAGVLKKHTYSLPPLNKMPVFLIEA